MSLRTLFDRVVDLELVADGAENARGNPTTSTTTVEGIRAYRSQVGAAEDTSDRDQQARTFVYLLEPYRPDGTPLGLTGRDRIREANGELLEVLGTPVLATSRGRLRHVEARAFVLEG